MHILIPVTGFGRAGGFRVLSNLANEWTRLGHRAAFLVPRWSHAPYYPTTAEILWVDGWGRTAEHQPPDPRSGQPRMAGPTAVLRALLALGLGIQRIGGRWDAIIANHSLTAWPVAMASGKAKKVYYVQAYEPEYYSSKAGIRNRVLQGLARASYALPLHQIANAPLYIGYGPCRATSWMPPGLDLDLFQPRSGGGDGTARVPLVVGCIGRPEPEKGTLLALQAFREFATRHPGVARFRLADFGVPRDWVTDPGLERVVPGNDAELADYYRSLDVLLALGTVQHGAHHYPVMEAMACGVAVVTTGYMPATPANAWIVDPTASAVANVLEEIHAAPRLVATKCQSARTAVEAYAWPAVARRFAAALAAL